MSADPVCAVVPAAGAGVRLGGERPKTYRTLAGRTVLEWALAPLLAEPRVERIVVVLAADDARFADLPIASDARIRTANGGPSRAASVRSGLAALADRPSDEPVLVHDGARPCLSAAELTRLLEAPAGPSGALLAVPVSDTLKRASDSGHVTATEERAGLWRALTPQRFGRTALDAALAAGREADCTDEANAMERAGHAPLLIEGDPANIKITHEHDLALAAAVLAMRAGRD